MKQVEVYKGRTVVLPVSLGFDVSQDTFTSEIRVRPSPSSTLIAAWDITFLTDGKDGELILRLDASITSAITQNLGYMDLKRVSGPNPLPVFDAPLEVVFLNTVTA